MNFYSLLYNFIKFCDIILLMLKNKERKKLSELNYNIITKYIPLVGTMKRYNKELFKKDLVAALTVAIVAIPQSMAYAIIAGLDPVYGIYTAIIATIIGSIFGSSEHLIAGPTNAISLLVASNMKNYMNLSNKMEILFLMTFMIGLLQIIFGLLKLGRVINYVSHSVIVGFTAGAGIIIALGQLNQLLGISTSGQGYMTLMQKTYYIFTHLNSTNLYSLGIGIFTIITIVVLKKVNKNLPGSLIAIIVCAAIAGIFSLNNYGVKLTASMPQGLPSPTFMKFDLNIIQETLSGVFAIAVIGLVEAISIAKSISSTSGQKIDANQEFIGQGMANMVGSFFKCYPGSGSFTRSAVNYFSGAKTRVAGILSGIFVAVVLIFFAPFAKYIPSPSLAGVIMVIAYNMVNKKEIKKVSKAGKSDMIVMWITIIATVFMPDLDYAIYMGIIISIILYLKDTNTVPVKILTPPQNNKFNFKEKEIYSLDQKVDILIIQLEGNLYFGSAYDLENKLDSLNGKAKVFILRMKRVSTIDITALDALKVFIKRAKESGSQIILCGVKSGLNTVLINTNLLGEIGSENIFMSEEEIFASSMRALDRAKEIINNK